MSDQKEIEMQAETWQAVRGIKPDWVVLEKRNRDGTYERLETAQLVADYLNANAEKLRQAEPLNDLLANIVKSNGHYCDGMTDAFSELQQLGVELHDLEEKLRQATAALVERIKDTNYHPQYTMGMAFAYGLLTEPERIRDALTAPTQAGEDR